MPRPLRPRPTSLTPETAEKVIAAIEAGNFKVVACAAAGIHRDTLQRWERLGAEGQEPYASFLLDLREAEARSEIALLKDIREAKPAIVGAEGPTPWQARAWILERRAGKRWGLRVRAQVNEELEALMKRLESKLDADTFVRVVDAAREDAPDAAADDDVRH